MMVPAAERTGMEAEKKEGENNEEDGDRDGGRWRQGTKKKLMETPSLQVSINQHKN